MLLGFRSLCTTWKSKNKRKKLIGSFRKKCGLQKNRARTSVPSPLGDPHPLRVQVLYGPGDGVKNGAGLSLREELLFEDPIQQLPSAHQLRHQEHLLTVVVHLGRQRSQGDFNASATLATLATLATSFFTLTSFSVMIFGCCPYRSRISISSEGSVLVLSIICWTQKERWWP